VGGIEKGNRLPTVPEFQMAASASYHWQVNNNWLGLVTGTYQHIGERFTQTGDQQPGFGTVFIDSFPSDIGGPYTQNVFRFNPELPAYDLVNLRLSFISSRFEVAAFVNNVTDERALLALDQERGTLARVGYLTNQPRTAGVTWGIHF
jgi:iron complex outermembrane receptor protein